MPRFHLHIHNSNGETLDEDGEELASLDEARLKAVDGVRSILSEEVRNGALDLRGHVDIATPGGEVLATVRFAETLRLELGNGQ